MPTTHSAHVMLSPRSLLTHDNDPRSHLTWRDNDNPDKFLVRLPHSVPKLSDKSVCLIESSYPLRFTVIFPQFLHSSSPLSPPQASPPSFPPLFFALGSLFANVLNFFGVMSSVIGSRLMNFNFLGTTGFP
ncbi:hypothetical protein M378DRAFT_867489 [Amanita muscaria Koide BX008]|uniref:Uncharacterized protein n=1 Tax=Amanita muscaria (strain Koide BX008) TaxID=946122 RepID=A0A0C2WI39_AMAMK|nr:hypothetical protein M378DRAFT_867489 [Amanita muscaria Koide BX008]